MTENSSFIEKEINTGHIYLLGVKMILYFNE